MSAVSLEDNPLSDVTPYEYVVASADAFNKPKPPEQVTQFVEPNRGIRVTN